VGAPAPHRPQLKGRSCGKNAAFAAIARRGGWLIAEGFATNRDELLAPTRAVCELDWTS
jgi:hypothetical protein